MINLDRKFTKLCCIINFPLGKKVSACFESLGSLNGYQYCGIIHDKDTKSDGELKTKHIHLVLILNKRQRAQTILNNIVVCFGIGTGNESQVQLQECLSIVGAIQYLTHKNNADKHKYNFDDIYSNLPIETLNEFYNQEMTDIVITSQTLYDLIVNKKYSLIDVANCIGCNQYVRLRPLIIDIFKVYRDITIR